MKLKGALKTALIALAGGALITALLWGIEHLNLTGRVPLTLDVGALSRDELRKELLARHPEVKFRCERETSDLGQTICFAEILSFNGIPARYFAFFFDKENHLTAFKLAAYASQYEALTREFTARFGEPLKPAGAPFRAWPTGGGVLTMADAPQGQEATVLWLNDPEVVEAYGGRAGGD